VGQAPLAFGVLGALEVRRDGVPISVPGERRRAVLAALLVRAGRPVSADALVEAAWGDELPAAPLPALHTVLSRLRTALGPGIFRADPAGYVLDAPLDAIDAARFEALRARAAGARAAEAATVLDQALALWRGPAYAEFADRGFAQGEAVRLDELRLSTVEDRAELSLQLGEAGSAVNALGLILQQHPFRERALGLLMAGLYQAGRPIEALQRYRDYRTVLADELGLDPSPTLRDLEVRILRHELPGTAPAPAPRRQLPPPPPTWLPASTAFVGRDDDEASLLVGVVAHRLVTVTGVGGVGKTRLVAEALGALSRRLELPITVVELDAAGAGQVDTAVAAALALGAPADRAREAVIEYLGISSGLLVLDNCEHVLSEARMLVEAALRRCPGIRVIATSRQRLGAAGEQVLPLEPLQVPSPGIGPEGAELTAAVRLFVDRVRRLRPAFELTPDAVRTVADICARLDGLPLALEMAATRAASLGLQPLRDRLDDSLELLGEDGQPRRQTLRAVMEWSYRLLDQPERRLLAALSVFDGDVGLDAAEHLADILSTGPAALSLTRLVEASLVAHRQAGEETRYRLLATVRAFAAEQLTKTGDEQAARLAHARWVRSLVETAARDAIGPGSAPAFTRLDRNRANAAAAVGWALQAGQPELAGRISGALALCPHWWPGAELLSLIGDVARHPDVTRSPVAALALGAGALIAAETGDLKEAERLGTLALGTPAASLERYPALLGLGMAELYRGRHDRAVRSWQEILVIPNLPAAYQSEAHASLALTACYRGGDLAAARRHAARARVAAGVAGASSCEAFAAYASGEIALLEDVEAALPLLYAAADEAGRCGAEQVLAVVRISLVSALTRSGHHHGALEVFPPLLHDLLRMSDWPQLWTALRILAELLVALDRPETAALLLAAADTAPSAPALAGADVERYRQLAEHIRECIGSDVVDRIGVLARPLPRAHVVGRALAAADDLRGRHAS
jgi:predicted ATPase/DNA-binding SARP family transcriptional activator